MKLIIQIEFEKEADLTPVLRQIYDAVGEMMETGKIKQIKINTEK